MTSAPGQNRRPALIGQLTRPAAYGHPTRDIQVIETHISWVILTGEYAYKIKKPVDLGFLDFSTLERRRASCEEELRVNRRTAPEWYLDVVPIAATPAGAHVGQEPAVEYAVRMRQFPHNARLDRCLQQGRIGAGEVRRLAATIAAFHAKLRGRDSADPDYEVERASRPARNNFIHLDPASFSDEAQQRLAVIESWTLQQAATLAPVFGDRAKTGAVRECHGDLHLENLLYIDGRFVPFDAIEFDPGLRWIDVANDIAFLTMDLLARDREDLAHTLLNAWLEETGDYDSLAVMRYYLVYRSMVRAVVLSIRQAQGGSRSPAEGSFRQGAERYVRLAADWVDTPAPVLYLMHGFSGSGKTWHSEHLVASLPALRVRSDLERKRLPDLRESQRVTGSIDSGLYGRDVTERTYQRLAHCCETGLRSGFDMIADAAFLHRWQRDLFHDLARRCGAGLVILDCAAPTGVLRERVKERAKAHSDASDAGPAVLEHQLARHDPLSEAERRAAVLLEPGESPRRTASRVRAAAPVQAKIKV